MAVAAADDSAAAAAGSTQEEGAATVKFEQALSGRSTCRASGEPIGKGEWRVGLEVWMGGRMATAWMKPLPFLRDCCRVEYALNPGGQQGSCHATGRKFSRGDVRFVATAGDPARKVYLCLQAAGEALRPVLGHVGRKAFKGPLQLAGVEKLAAGDRAAFCQAFGVPKAEADRFDRQHPPPAPPSLEKAPAAAAAGRSKGKGKSGSGSAAKGRGSAASEGEQEEEKREEGEPEGEEVAGVGRPPAKRARRGGGGAAASAARTGEQGEEEEGPQALTEMERQRAELIRRNRERMMALNLPGMAAELMPAVQQHKAPPAAKHKGVSRKRLTEVLPRRESSRLRGIAADGSQVHSERQGEVVVVAGEVIRRYASGMVSEEQEPQDRHPQGELGFESMNSGPSTDEAFIQLLAHAAASANSGIAPSAAGSRGRKQGKSKHGGGSSDSGVMGVAGMRQLRLDADDVAKVTKDATTHLAFHPTTDTLIVACADKKGNVGLWHVNEGTYELPAAARRERPILRGPAKQQGEAAAAAAAAAAASGAVALDGSAGAAAGAGEEGSTRIDGSEEPSGSAGGNGDGGGSGGAFDGVLSLQPPHYEYISGLKWAGGSGRSACLFTASYDGSLRRLDVERGVSELVVSSEEAEYSCMDVTGDGRTALLGDNEGALVLVDARQRQQGGSGALTVHSKKINTVHFEPTQEQVFATASTDTTIRLWDLRAWGQEGVKPLATANHPQTCQAAMFAPDGSRRIVSTSFDNTVRIWDGAAGLAPRLTIKHDNNTGRWVLPFRAVWNAAGDGVIVGNMKRFIDCFDASSGELVAQLHSEHQTAIASRNAVHPAGLLVLAGATNSGRIHIYRQ